MAGRAESVYARLPVWAQHVAVTTYGLWWKRLRFGGGFEAHCRTFRERESWTETDWSTWRTERLRVLRGRRAGRWREAQKPSKRALVKLWIVAAGHIGFRFLGDQLS